ncbi:molybdate ABC transporter permease subunit [Alkalihalobacillus pseudalcaliphilus]|uniref:molybdate ABC transporter permease subunit n=1 Tax=Alkalihalobacillus pseudalcaliphilus TaxID=79884 RepID=UPI00064DDE92|nr:molybdate ABC transporter permease subunit [Alkalihalobacillus pseudalcaliphilus]KMK78088.1 molybdenum ABC transporter permease [Alkalihalobacillus pseudalcaliphilus]
MTDFWTPVQLSLTVASLALIIVLIVGTLVAKWMAHRSFKGKSLIDTLLLLPLVLPPSVVGFLLIIVFGRHSFVGQLIETISGQPIIFTTTAAIIAATVVAFPLMYQSAVAGFETINRDIENAARVDGANEFKVFSFITLPLAAKAIISGGILSFARALGEFGATLMFAGNLPGRTQTIPTAIYVAMDSGNMTLAWQWVIVILLISFGMLMMVNLLRRRY